MKGKPPKRLSLEDITKYDPTPMTIKNDEYLIIKVNEVKWVYKRQDETFKRTYKL